MVDETKIKKLFPKAWLEKKPRIWLYNISLKLFTETERAKAQSTQGTRRLRS